MIPIIDSHIHLFPASHLETLSWYSPSNPLASQHSIEQYRQATSSNSTDEHKQANADTDTDTYLKGFVFLETDRKSSTSHTDWTNVLDEISFLSRVIRGTPVEGEGHTQFDKELCLGIVPWAPIPGGPDVLGEYFSKVSERISSLTDGGDQGQDIWEKIKGVRYLVQDKAKGTMLGDAFVDGLKWLGQKGLVFDLGVDARQGGMWQLEEAAELMKRVYESESGSGLKIVINHLCKPNLRLAETTSPSEIQTHPDFISWKSQITALSRYPNTYIKLSGLLSELPPLPPSTQSQPQSDEEQHLLESTARYIQPWTDVVFDTFGASRMMFGSDWPVCNIGGGGNQISWQRWKAIVTTLLGMRGIDEDAKKDVWYRTAAKAYGITL